MATIKPAFTVYVIFITMWGTILLIGFAVVFRLGDWSFPVMWIGLIGAISSAMMITRYRIYWNKDKIIYRGLINTQNVLFSSIRKYGISGPSKNNRFGPTLGLSIFSNSKSDPVIIINLKPFSRKDIAQVLIKLEEIVKNNNK